LLRKKSSLPQEIDGYQTVHFAQTALNVADSEIFAKKINFPAGFGCSLQLA
jgi:hypothetical protein